MTEVGQQPDSGWRTPVQSYVRPGLQVLVALPLMISTLHEAAKANGTADLVTSLVFLAVLVGFSVPAVSTLRLLHSARTELTPAALTTSAHDWHPRPIDLRQVTAVVVARAPHWGVWVLSVSRQPVRLAAPGDGPGGHRHGPVPESFWAAVAASDVGAAAIRIRDAALIAQGPYGPLARPQPVKVQLIAAGTPLSRAQRFWSPTGERGGTER